MLGINKETKPEAALARKQEVEASLAPVDVFENEKEFLLVADLPGVPQGAADVTLEKNRLIVQATASTRKYRRELIVPPSVDAEAVEAQIKSGVLTVRLPKRPAQDPRQIAVRAG